MTVWTVPAHVERVVDGDTLVLDLDLGWGVWLHDKRCRLAGINCPEINTPEGMAARDFVKELLPRDSVITFVSRSLDKYGRPLGYVRLANGSDLATLLVNAGHASVML